jgi:hypothetical protein
LELDELTTPLGQKPQKGRTLPVLIGVLSLFGLAVGVWAFFAYNPLDSLLVAVESTLSASQTDARDGKHRTGNDRQDDSVPLRRATAFRKVPTPDAKIITIIDASTGEQRDVTISLPTPSRSSPPASVH